MRLYQAFYSDCESGAELEPKFVIAESLSAAFRLATAGIALLGHEITELKLIADGSVNLIMDGGMDASPL